MLQQKALNKNIFFFFFFFSGFSYLTGYIYRLCSPGIPIFATCTPPGYSRFQFYFYPFSTHNHINVHLLWDSFVILNAFLIRNEGVDVM